MQQVQAKTTQFFSRNGSKMMDLQASREFLCSLQNITDMYIMIFLETSQRLSSMRRGSREKNIPS